jgi:hypothetical protein
MWMLIVRLTGSSSPVVDGGGTSARSSIGHGVCVSAEVRWSSGRRE